MMIVCSSFSNRIGRIGVISFWRCDQAIWYQGTEVRTSHGAPQTPVIT